jgi:hypothetical protein
MVGEGIICVDATAANVGGTGLVEINFAPGLPIHADSTPQTSIKLKQAFNRITPLFNVGWIVIPREIIHLSGCFCQSKHRLVDITLDESN